MAYKTRQTPLPRKKCKGCGKIFRPWFKEGQDLCYNCDKRSLLERWSKPDRPAEIEKGVIDENV